MQLLKTLILFSIPVIVLQLLSASLEGNQTRELFQDTPESWLQSKLIDIQSPPPMNVEQLAEDDLAETTAVQATEASDDVVVFDPDFYEMQGAELARLQIKRGLYKPLERSAPRDQSIAGLRDVINDSNDRMIRQMTPVVNELEVLLKDQPDSGRNYTSALVEDMTPISLYIQEKTGIPASVLLAQVVLESGWGGSNVTILKNNILGLGNSVAYEKFEVTLDLGDEQRVIPVVAPHDTSAYAFENIGDSIFYYVYVLLQSPDNANHYAALREYIATHRELERTNPDQYRHEVIRLIAKSYHSDPTWYRNYLLELSEKFKDVESKQLIAMVD